MRRRAIVVWSGLGSCLTAAFVACSFPNVTFTPVDELEASTPDASLEASSGDSGLDSTPAADGGEVLIDGASPDALIGKDAGGRVDAQSCAPAECDCDKDGFKDTLKPGCNSGPNDCDDNDSRARPDQAQFLEDAEAPMFGDWNCDGTREGLYPINVTCEGLTLGLNCPKIFGFTGAPLCGTTANWIRCKQGTGLNFLNCEVDTQAQVRQPCR